MVSRSFWLIAWLPLAVLIATEIYVAQFEGWGQWAAGPMFLLPLGMSAILVFAGLFQCLDARRAGQSYVSPAAATLLAGAPVLWFLVRALLR